MESLVVLGECGLLECGGRAESSGISSIGSAPSTGMESEDMKVAEGLLDRIVGRGSGLPTWDGESAPKRGDLPRLDGVPRVGVVDVLCIREMAQEQ